ncbi:MAG TPA: DUF5947 family protein, partial [Cryptosporangiaceae bacterium]|nr:DUF5947 family protein [Cryptosporangiaceae bacterium]
MTSGETVSRDAGTTDTANTDPASTGASTNAVLRRLLTPKPAAQPGERCEMCGEPLAVEHGHVVHLENRALMCACRPCALLFSNKGAGSGRY